MGATNETSGDAAWLLATVESLEKQCLDIERRLSEAERELADTVRRRDSIEMPGSVKDGPGAKVYVDLADEAGARALVEAAIRVRQYAADLRSGAQLPPPMPTEGGA